ncbi:MAG TPA: PKD domain-containing protein [Baekduia sp.]|jgi:hypothetical protein
MFSRPWQRWLLVVGVSSFSAMAPAGAMAATQSFEPPVQATVVGVGGGQVYLTGGGNKVYRYGTDFTPLGSFGGFGTDAGEFGSPVAIDVGDDGEVFVADLDYNNFPGQEFTADGTPVRTFDTCCHGQALDVALVGDEVDILGNGGAVARYQADGTYVSSFTAYSGSESASMAASPLNGDLYVVGRISQDVREYTPTGTLVRTWNADFGDGVATAGIAVDPAGDVYVAGSSTVKRFGPTGTPAGSYTSDVQMSDIAIDGAELYLAQSFRVTRVDIGVPQVSLAASRAVAGPGESVTLSATASVPFGTVARYEWDLDGDGTFETDTGTDPVATFSRATPGGPYSLRVRVTADGGATATAETSVTVMSPGLPPAPTPPGPAGPALPTPPTAPTPPAPPRGRVGVSINGGAQYTNNPHVTVNVVWPWGATTALLSNDGGFRATSTLPLTASLPWTLASSGPERLPKTVYLRFDGSPPNYTDDIILDETPPAVDTASLAVAPPTGTAHAAAAKPRYVLRLKAHDKTSGVAQVQVATRKTHPAKAVKYTSRLKVSSRPRYVRVRDRAGNYSRWRSVR